MVGSPSRHVDLAPVPFKRAFGCARENIKEGAETKSLNLSSLVKGIFFDEGILAKFFPLYVFPVERLEVFTWQAQRV